MAKTNTKRGRATSKVGATARRQASSQQLDGVFFLKLVLYLVVGMQWIRFVGADGSSQFPVPIGLLLGLLFALHDHFKIDRKIEFAVLLVAMLVGFWSQMGIYITI